MAKVVLTANDDADQTVTTGVCVTNGATAVVGTGAGQKNFVGYRFTNVAVAQGTTGRRVVLRLYLSAIAIAAAPTFRIACEAADNAAAFTTGVNDLSGRTLTASTALDNTRTHDLPAGAHYAFDITDAANAVFARAGWVSGNALVVMIHTPGGASCATVEMLEGTTGTDPQLSIVYGDNADAERGSGAEENVDASWVNISNIRTDNATNASGTDVSTDSPFTAKDFGIADLTSKAVDDIAVRLNHSASSIGTRARVGVELSWDGGTSWTAPKYTLQPDVVVADQFVSGGPAGWGHTFTPAELTNANFRLRVTPDFATVTPDSAVDFVGVTVYYHSTGQTVALGLITETDTVGPVTAAKTATLARVTETDTVNPLGVAKSAALGRVTESDSLFPLGVVKTVALARIDEADTLGPLGAAKTVALGLVTETDTLGALTLSRGVSVGRIDETDTLFPLAFTKTVALGRIDETDTVNALTARLRMQRGCPPGEATARVCDDLAAVERECPALVPTARC